MATCPPCGAARSAWSLPLGLCPSGSLVVGEARALAMAPAPGLWSFSDAKFKFMKQGSTLAHFRFLRRCARDQLRPQMQATKKMAHNAVGRSGAQLPLTPAMEQSLGCLLPPASCLTLVQSRCGAAPQPGHGQGAGLCGQGGARLWGGQGRDCVGGAGARGCAPQCGVGVGGDWEGCEQKT